MIFSSDRFLSWTHNANLLTVTLLVDGLPNRANLLFCLQVVCRFRHPPGARGFLLVHQLYHQCCQHSPRCSHGANGPGPHTQRDEMLTWPKWKTRPTNSVGTRSISSVRRNQKFVSFSTSANCQLSSSTKSRSACWQFDSSIDTFSPLSCVWIAFAKQWFVQEVCRKRRLFEIRLQEHEALWLGVSERRRVSSPWSEFESWNRNMELLWALPVQKDEQWISATLTIFWEIARFGQKGPPDAQIGSALRQGPLPYRDSWFRQGSFARGAFMGRLSPHNGPRIKAKWNGYQVLLLPAVFVCFCRLQRYIMAFCLIYLQEIFMPWLLLADFLPVWCFLECKSSTNPLSIQDATLIILPDCQNFQYNQSWVMTNYLDSPSSPNTAL